MTSVLLVDDDSRARETVRTILTSAADIEVVGEASGADEAIAELGERVPDVIVCGLSAPGMQDSDAIKHRHARLAQIPRVVLTRPAQSLDVDRLLRTGALGFVDRQAAAAELLPAVRAVHAGTRYVCMRLRPTLEQPVAEERRVGQPLANLTLRELQILRLLAAGKTNRETAQSLGLSRKTVSTHRTLILAKLGLRNNVELARFAIEHGLLNS